MAHSYHHAESSARRYGGVPGDYQAIHTWFDASKTHYAHPMHRALRHHTAGIFEAERIFGVTLTNSAGRIVPVRWIGEQHVKEDCRMIPSLADWFARIAPAPWMANGQIITGSPPLEGDARSGWKLAVASEQTVLGYEDWMAERGAVSGMASVTNVS